MLIIVLQKMLFLFFFFFGIILGSFLNVVALRMERDEDFVHGRSACPRCAALIRWYDNIPLLSYIFLCGRCRNCHEKISWRYPAVELMTGIVSAIIGSLFFDPADIGTWVETVWLLGLFAFFIVIALYDGKTMEIPVVVLEASAIWTLVFLVLRDWMFSTDMIWSVDGRTVSGLIAALLAWGVFAALSFFSKETWMGWGDSWLAAIVGLAVGTRGILFALTLSFGVGALFSIFLLARGRAGMETRVPFGPFLVLGTFLYFILFHFGFFRYGLFLI